MRSANPYTSPPGGWPRTVRYVWVLTLFLSVTLSRHQVVGEHSSAASSSGLSADAVSMPPRPPPPPPTIDHQEEVGGEEDAAAADDEDSSVSLGLSRDQERILVVRTTLCSRLKYVLDGTRSKDFSSWIRQHGGETRVLSMHGVDLVEDFNFGTEENTTGLDFDFSFHIDPKTHELELEMDIFTRRPGDPFPANRLSLDLPTVQESTTGRSYYCGKFREWDHRKPSLVKLAIRAAKLSCIFAPVTTTSPLALVSRQFREKIWYKWVASCLASAGAATIKWGQWASTRNDMFPLELCDALSELHNSAPSHSWDFSQKVVECSLDIPEGSLFEVFESFDSKPMASGSIAQVHKAKLKDGTVVAAKVRHPRVAELIDTDFRLFGILASICNFLPGLRWLHIKDSVSQFSHTMAAQADLHVEAHHLEVLNHNFRKWPHVQFPRPFFASEAVILETFQKGRICTDIIDWYDEQANELHADAEGHELIPMELAKFIVTTGVSVYLKMLLVDNLMHADLHPGNIMLDVEDPVLDRHGQLSLPNSTQQLSVTLVDAGMVAQLTEEESNIFIGLLAAIGEGDGRAAAELSLRFSIENKMRERKKKKYVRDMERLFAERCRGYGTNVDVGDVLRGVLTLIRRYKVRIDANYATLVINALCVESLATRVCPTYNLLDASKPLLQGYRRFCFESDGVTPVENKNVIEVSLSLLLRKFTLVRAGAFACV